MFRYAVMLAFLALDAAQFITGEDIVADGGHMGRLWGAASPSCPLRVGLLGAGQDRARRGERRHQGVQVGFADTEMVQGRMARAVEMSSGCHALIERLHDFALVPWRPVLERHFGREVAGVVRETGINWTIGRQPSGPSVS